MASPCLTNFFELVSRDVQVLKLLALNGGQFRELVVGDIEPFEVEESVFEAKDGHALYAVIGQVQTN